MKYANKIGAAYVIVLGDNEISSGKAELRNMSDSTSAEIMLDSVVDTIKNIADRKEEK